MLTQIRYRIGTAAIAVWLISVGGALAKQAPDLPEMPFDEMAQATGEFAEFSTPSTPVDPSIDPTAGSGQPTEESPEPATLSLLGLGGVGAWWHLRRRKAATDHGNR